MRTKVTAGATEAAMPRGMNHHPSKCSSPRKRPHIAESGSTQSLVKRSRPSSPNVNTASHQRFLDGFDILRTALALSNALSFPKELFEDGSISARLPKPLRRSLSELSMALSRANQCSTAPRETVRSSNFFSSLKTSHWKWSVKAVCN